MLSKLLTIGIDGSLDLEDKARVRLQNAMALVGMLINIFFIFYHLLFTHKLLVSTVLFCLSLIAPLVFVFHHKKKYIAAKISLFVFLYILIFAVSTILLVGHGNEYYYIALSILVLVLNKNTHFIIVIIIFNIFLFLLPHFYYPNIQEEYIISTHIAVFISALLAVLFFRSTQNKFRGKLKEQKVHLEKLNLEKDDLMSIVAHDLKTPLAQIEGLVSILELDKKQLTTDQLHLLEKIKGVAENQNKQISAFLNISTVDENLEINKVLFDTVLSTNQVIANLSTLLQTKKIRIIEQYELSNIEIEGFKSGFQKIMVNLLSNAIKYSHEKSLIILNISTSKEHILITIKDEGQGFKKEELGEVFSKNKVLSAQPTSNETASGIGLYIVKKYVDLMDGEIWLESTEGKGSTFFVKLPKGT